VKTSFDEGRLSYRGSLQALKKENPALQNMKNFFTFFFFCWSFLQSPDDQTKS